MNVERKEHFKIVCVWPGTLVEGKIAEFEKFMMDEFGVRVQYLEEIKTNPDKKKGVPVPDTGDRNDVFFAIHMEDVGKFAMPRFQYGIRWLEDVIAPYNHGAHLYPKRVKAYLK
jgi:hypothetical protein